MDLKKMEQGVLLILQGMGVDLKDDNFRGTPKRVAKMYHEMLTPQASNWATFPASNSDLVLLRGHRVVGICPHHLQPVEYSCSVAYIPNQATLGLSKLARVVEHQLVVPILQEDLTNDVADALDERLRPKGTAVIIVGKHGCMRFRGVETEGDVVTSSMRGIFLLNPTAKQELLSLIGRP